MGTKSNRSLKSKANKMQHQMLQPLIAYNKNVQQYGEAYVLLDTARQMQKYGVVTEDEVEEFADWLLLGEMLRQIHKNLQSGNSHSEIDTSKLFIGMTVRNYKELCQLLGVTVKTGKARQLQEKEFLRFFDYEKMRHSNEYIILDVYPEPLPTGSKGYRNTLFVNQLKVLILRELLQEQENEEGNIVYYTTYSRLIKTLGIISEYFYMELSKFFVVKFPEWFMKDTALEQFLWNYEMFKRVTLRKIKGSIEYALNALMKDDLIWFSTYNQIGIKTDNGTTHFRKATTAEEIYITSVKKEVSTSLGYSNSRTASLYAQEKFNRLFSQRIKTEMGWDFVYHQIEIGTKKDTLRKHINEYTSLPVPKSIYELTADEVTEYRQIFNNNLSNSLIEQANKNCEDRIAQYAERIKTSDPKFNDCSIEEIVSILNLSDEEYMEKQKAFVDYLIRNDDHRKNEIIHFLQSITADVTTNLSTDY